MRDLVLAEGPLLTQILDASYEIWGEGLARPAYARYNLAQLETAWGRAHLRRLALVERSTVVASAKRYDFAASLNGRLVPLVGLGALFTQPAFRRRGHATELVNRLLEQAARDGAVLAVLFSEIGADYYGRLGFERVATTSVTLRVTEGRGAPATMVRGGEERDLQAIAVMGRARAEGYRFHLDRDPDFIRYAVTKKRLLAGLGPVGARELHFFIAEEGTTAAAYIVISSRPGVWTIEECGDRDPSGARVGALLQALLAREPSVDRPVIQGWLPSGFLPPQVVVSAAEPSGEIMMMKALSPAAGRLPPAPAELLYWHGDTF